MPDIITNTTNKVKKNIDREFLLHTINFCLQFLIFSDILIKLSCNVHDIAVQRRMKIKILLCV